MTASLDLIANSMEKVEDLLNQTFTDHALETHVNAMCQHVIKAGGKRLRPKLLLLAAHALPLYNHPLDEENICHMAAAVEFLHTATLVHDDVIDKSPMRRGQPTLNETDGNHAAVLAGDYLFTRCFDLLQKPENFAIIRAMSKTLRQLVTGELYQLEHEGDINLSIDHYYVTIYAKTGVLFELAASAAAIMLSDDPSRIEELQAYGRNLGTAFQIKDDMLDYTSNAEDLGKDTGADLEDQRITLPVLIALRDSNESERADLIKAIKEIRLADVKAAIARTDAIAKCEAIALDYCHKAIANLACLPESKYKEAMINVCLACVNRAA